MNRAASSARCWSASSKTMTGFLPPSSKCTRLSVAAPWRMICEPVVVSPTKATALIAGCSVSALARAFAQAVHEIDDAGGAAMPADFRIHDLGQDDRGERAPFRGLVHDRAAGRQRGRDLPCRQHERRVPRRDHADGADRLAQRIIDVVGVGHRRGRRPRRARGRRRSGSSRRRAARPSPCSGSAGPCRRIRPARSRRRALRWRRRWRAGSRAAWPPEMSRHARNARAAARAARSISAASPAATIACLWLVVGIERFESRARKRGDGLAGDEMENRRAGEALEIFGGAAPGWRRISQRSALQFLPARSGLASLGFRAVAQVVAAGHALHRRARSPRPKARARGV